MINILLLMLLFFLFFSYALVSLQLIFPVIAVGVVVIFLIKRFAKPIVISQEDYIWLFCVIVNIIGLIKAPKFNEAIIFSGFILIFILLKISLSNFEGWKETFIKGTLFFSSVHVFATLIQYFNPEIVQRVTQVILPSAAYNVNRYQATVGKYAGITGQVGANAFFITIFLAIKFCHWIEKKKKNRTGLFFMIGFVALILTTKRGLLLFNMITLIVIVLIVKFSKLNKNNKVGLFLLVTLMIGLLVIIGLSLVANTPLLNQLLVDNDITSGRMEIYGLTLELVKSAPLLGNGLSSVEHQIGIKSHNIYLQLWAELGLLGLITYLLAMAVTLGNSIKLYIGIKKEEYLNSKNIVLTSIYIQIIFILYGLTGNVLYDYFIVGIYMIAISLPGAVRFSFKKARFLSM